MNPLLLLTLASILAITTPQNCAPSLVNDQLQTGTYTFVLSGQRVQCYNTSLTSLLVSQPQLAYGISNIFNYANDNSGVDFSLRGHIDSPQLLSFTLVVNNATYTSITISYLLSTRPDIYGGSYIADTNQLLECNSVQNALISIPVSPLPSIPASNTLAILIFVNGIRTQSWLYNLKFQQPVLDLTGGLINVTVMTDAIFPIQTIFFSYLIMDLSRLGSTFTYSFTAVPTTNDFGVSGLVSFSNNTNTQIQTAYISLNKTNKLTCVGLTCSVCLSAASCTAAGGVVTGNQCIKCASNQAFVAGPGCICSNGYFLINGSCSVCPAGSIYSTSSQNCVACGVNAGLINDACTCNSGYFNISGSCGTCPAGTAYNRLTLICTSICGGGQQWLNGVCSCSSGTFLINGICGVCSQGYSYSASTSNCLQICTGAYQVFSNGQCICIQGYTLSNNACVLTTSLTTTTITTTSGSETSSGSNCGANQYILNGACKCYSNYVQYQGKCYTCPDYSSVTLDQTGCVCNQGYTLTSSFTCAPISSSSGSYLASNTSGGSSASTTSTTGSSTSSTVSSSSTTTITSSTSGGPDSSSGSSQGYSTQQQCQIGSYYDGNFCQLCSSYCISCFTSNICISCTAGFYLTQSYSNGVFTSSCSEICGDAKKFILPCDDGNNINGDGCSSTCSIEAGWTCSGGSVNGKDVCLSQIPQISSRISLLRNVVFGNALYQNVMLSPLPINLTTDGCPSCPYLINATLGTAPAGSIIQSNFIGNTQYQYVLTAIIPNTNISTGVLVLNVRLNTTFAAYFSAADMAQQQSLIIDLSNVTVITPGITYSVNLPPDSLNSNVVDNTKLGQVLPLLGH